MSESRRALTTELRISKPSTLGAQNVQYGEFLRMRLSTNTPVDEVTVSRRGRFSPDGQHVHQRKHAVNHSATRVAGQVERVAHDGTGAVQRWCKCRSRANTHQ